MTRPSNLSRHLREEIVAILGGAADSSHLNRLVSVSHALASSFLASKRTITSISTASGLSISDLAYDCIAELFQQDQNGCYIQLCAYFSGIAISDSTDEELLAHLRRLVFSKVNHGVFRLHSEFDPALAKILRNVKIAIGSLHNFTEVERFGEACVSPSLCDPLEHLPPWDRDELERGFLALTSGNEQIPELLGKLSLLLREDHRHCRIVPLILVALLIRASYLSKHQAIEMVANPDGRLDSDDIQSAIKRACAAIGQQAKGTYVGSGKLSSEMFDQYVRAIEDHLRNKFVEDDGSSSSLQDFFTARVPGVSKEVYLKEHRHRLEYLLKLAEREAVKRLREDR